MQRHFQDSFESVLMRWMKLEPNILREVSQKDKDQYSILTHIYGILKDGNDNPISKTDIDLKNRLLDMVGEGESGMISENSTEIYTLIITLYAKQKKRHRCTEETFGLCGRRQGWDVLREQHQNIYII